MLVIQWLAVTERVKVAMVVIPPHRDAAAIVPLNAESIAQARIVAEILIGVRVCGHGGEDGDAR